VDSGARQAEVEVKVERRSDVLIVASTLAWTSTFSALADFFSILLEELQAACQTRDVST
jgi:hypothetical protein